MDPGGGGGYRGREEDRWRSIQVGGRTRGSPAPPCIYNIHYISSLCQHYRYQVYNVIKLLPTKGGLEKDM